MKDWGNVQIAWVPELQLALRRESRVLNRRRKHVESREPWSVPEALEEEL